jgi:hypothetical protein
MPWSNPTAPRLLSAAEVAERVSAVNEELQAVVAEGFDLVGVTEAAMGGALPADLQARIEETRYRLRRLGLLLAEFDTTT